MSSKACSPFLLAVILLFLSPKGVKAQVVINEFSSNTSSDWIELYSSVDVEISSWVLDDYDTATNLETIPPSTFIGPSSSNYYLVEVSNRLNKDGDTIYLYDGSNIMIDEIGYGDKGDLCLPSDSGSIGRYPDANSTIDRLSTHTKGVTNNTGILDPCPTPSPSPSPTTNPTESPTPDPTSSPTPSPNPSPTPTVKSASTTFPASTKQPSSQDDDFLELRETLNATISPSPEVLSSSKGKFPTASIFFLLSGASFIGISGYSFFKQKQKGYTNNSKDEKDSNDEFRKIL